ncbi:uncharacterized protein [Rutidosis leptorrhynchoides]|uniref:uncharacterized protein n=1 Tax=Rutidosis leptorrhynchoides TaxID=125765 RepID=UPI003A98F715
MNKAESWKPVVSKFEKRLADWKAHSMSFGGRLTLNVLVKDRVSWNGSYGFGTWQWKRFPTGRSLKELEELNELIKSVQVDVGKHDSWWWSLNKKGVYETYCMSELLNSKILEAGTNRFETLRNNLVPKKVEVFIWRTRKRRLAVLTELDKRGIDLNSTRCPVCDDDVETVDDSLLFCKEAFDIWAKVHDWWGLSGVVNVSMGETKVAKIGKIARVLAEKSFWRTVEFSFWNRQKNGSTTV